MSTLGAQTHVVDPRNETVLVYLDGRLVPRNEAMVSVFDAGFVLGDGLWEGFRLVNNRLPFANDHIDRLFDGARAIDLEIGKPRGELIAAIEETCKANKMIDGVHIRLMVTRGRKSTPNQDPRNVIGPPTIVIVAEWKEPSPEIKQNGMVLFTSTFRCASPDVLDMRLNSHSRLHLIRALQQAIAAGAHEALMLDPHGFVASCNSTNFFIIKGGVVMTSIGRYSFMGITRGNVIKAAKSGGLQVEECDFTLSEAYAADEAFVTGTFGGVTAVRSIDGKTIGKSAPGPLTRRLTSLYEGLQATGGTGMSHSRATKF
jgi:branched-chain amino acid aminotransferase